MLKKAIVLIQFCLLILGVNAQDKINWLTWEEAYEKAKNENKMILVDVVSDNCKFCLKMEKVTFIDNKIIEQINENYIPVKINSDREEMTFKIDDKEYNMNQMLAFLTNNSVMSGRPKMAFPTLVFIYADDHTRYFETGYQDPSIFKYMLANCIKEKEKRDKKKNKKKK